MVATSAPAPPPGRTSVTFAEIAAHYGKSPRYVAENPRWGRHPDWPAPTGKRGRSLEFAPAAVASFVDEHHTRDTVQLAPDRLYTVAEIAEATGLRPDSIRADISRGRWPAPDTEGEGQPSLWTGSTVAEHLANRRAYRRAT
ncbi:helix-turn-helix transcriptional regulator [Streptomyces sp. NPDC057854]|uniref:helix-turn-helix transcriptional regulator n=1 Tax=unclassified Streptomyces TaxID=2593676 RepID=UPI0036B962DB